MRALNAWLAARRHHRRPGIPPNLAPSAWQGAGPRQSANRRRRTGRPRERGTVRGSRTAAPPQSGKAALTTRWIADIVQGAGRWQPALPAPRPRRPQPQARRADHRHGTRQSTRPSSSGSAGTRVLRRARRVSGIRRPVRRPSTHRRAVTTAMSGGASCRRYRNRRGRSDRASSEPHDRG